MKGFVAGGVRTHNKGGKGEYDYFLPNTIHHSYRIENKKILRQAEQAAKLLGELNAYGEIVPDIDFFIEMHILSESVASSKIEGTQTDIEDALMPESEVSADKRDDWDEVQNYIKTMNQSIKDLDKLPVSVRLIKKAHRRLLSGVRGKHKKPGEIRKSQNWIGGASIDSAHFVPPHHQHIGDLLADWEHFWHNNHDLPVLVKVALCHYQFETIHPFLDGNGRIGRLLIILQLIERGFLARPIFYFSVFFEKHRPAYYRALDKVRTDNDIDQWLLFFLEGVIATAEQSKSTLQAILALKADFENRIAVLGKKVRAADQTLKLLYANPVIRVKRLQHQLKLRYSTTNNLVKDFVRLGILKEVTGQKRNRIFVMDEYIGLFRGQ